jgi:hypothetical protein
MMDNKVLLQQVVKTALTKEETNIFVTLSNVNGKYHVGVVFPKEFDIEPKITSFDNFQDAMQYYTESVSIVEKLDDQVTTIYVLLILAFFCFLVGFALYFFRS